MSNQLTTRGACTIATYLPRWKSVKRLSLNGNKIGEKGAEHLYKGLKENVELLHVDLTRGFLVADDIQFLLILNGIGRRLFQGGEEDESLSVSIGLWPVILERANRRGYSAELSASVLYHMLGMLCPVLFSST